MKNAISNWLNYIDFINSPIIVYIDAERIRDADGNETFEKQFAIQSFKKNGISFSTTNQLNIHIKKLYEQIRKSFRVVYYEEGDSNSFQTYYQKLLLSIKNSLSNFTNHSNGELIKSLELVEINGFDYIDDTGKIITYPVDYNDVLTKDDYELVFKDLLRIFKHELHSLNKIKEGTKSWILELKKNVKPSITANTDEERNFDREIIQLNRDFPIYWTGDPKCFEKFTQELVSQGFIIDTQYTDFINLFQEKKKAPVNLPIMWMSRVKSFAFLVSTLSKVINKHKRIIEGEGTPWRYFENGNFFKHNFRGESVTFKNLKSKLPYKEDNFSDKDKITRVIDLIKG